MNNILKFKKLQDLNHIEKDNLPVSRDNNGKIISTYKDNKWDFSKSLSNRANGLKVINFDYDLDNGLSLINHTKLLGETKDFTYIQLNAGLKYRSVIGNIRNFFVFLNFIITVKKIESLENLNRTHIVEYIDYLKIKYTGKSVSRITNLLVAVKILEKYSNSISFKVNKNIFDGISIKKNVSRNSNYVKKAQTDIIPDALWKSIVETSSKQIYLYLKNIEIEKNIIRNCNDYYKQDLFNKYRYFSKEFIQNYSQYGGVYINSPTHFKYMKETIIACGIIIQAFTGMRISELLALKYDSIIEERVENSNHTILKLKSKTFKYIQEQSFKQEEGKIATWLCPPIVADAIKVLETISSQRRDLYNYFLEEDLFKEYHNDLRNHKDYLFVPCKFSKSPILMTSGDISLHYKSFLSNKGLDIGQIKLSSHCFRRTLARFFARSLIKLPIEILKEQFKHYSSDITSYYMKEDLNNDFSFSENITNNGANNNEMLLFSKVTDKISNSLLTATNIDELISYANGKQLQTINQYMSSLNEENKNLSAIECLSCDGVIILPEFHVEFWKEMLTVYQEVMDLEPNNQWYKLEMKMIENVVKTLEKGEIYMVKEDK